MYKITVLILNIFVPTIFADNLGPVISISSGLVQGTVRKTIEGNQYHVFEGIPYAAPPVGDDRFKVPRDPENWNGILKATNNSHMCLQVLGVGIYQETFSLTDLRGENNIHVGGSEDCLYLNIYTPANLSSIESQELPVLVWIHGGAYQFDSKQHLQPQAFIDHDIIVVTFNYRLGVLGFLSTTDGVIPSNMAQKDQHFVLKWISKNIKQFGGDPTKVILGGLSSGSSATSFHLLSPRNKGLFRGVIMESGTALSQHHYFENPKDIAFELGKMIDPTFTGNSEDLLKLLRKVTPNKLIEYANSESLRSKFEPIDSSIRLKMIDIPWVPTLEHEEDPESLITKPMHQSFIDGDFIKVPILTGFTSEEALGIPSYKECIKNAHNIDAHPEILVSPKLNIVNNVDAGRKLKNLYTTSFQENPGAHIQFLSDSYYTTPILRQADLARKHVPVYLYQFAYESKTFKREHVAGAERVGHVGHVPFLWGDKIFSNKQDQLTRDRMIKLWTNFVKFLNPTLEDDDLLIKWPQTTSNLEYLNINNTLSVLTNPRKYQAWKEILDQYMSPPFNVY